MPTILQPTGTPSRRRAASRTAALAWAAWPVDGRIDDPHPLGRRDAPPYRLGRDGPAHGQEHVGSPPEVTLDADVGAAAGPGLELVEREAVERVHHARRASSFRGQPAQGTGLRAVRVDYVVARLRQVVGQQVQAPEILPGRDRGDQLGQIAHAQACFGGAGEQLVAAAVRVSAAVGVASDDRDLVAIWVKCESAAQRDPARAGLQAGDHHGHG